MLNHEGDNFEFFKSTKAPEITGVSKFVDGENPTKYLKLRSPIELKEVFGKIWVILQLCDLAIFYTSFSCCVEQKFLLILSFDCSQLWEKI